MGDSRLFSQFESGAKTCSKGPWVDFNMAAVIRAISAAVESRSSSSDRSPPFSSLLANKLEVEIWNSSKMGNLSSHEDCEAETPSSVGTGTPACRDLSYLDPRSPTLEIVRTPLEVPPTRRSRLRRLVSLLDPRSPSLQLNRTPLQIPHEAVQPVAKLQPQATDLEATDLAEQVSVHAEDDRPAEHVDPKLARALFFGDMSVSDSPAPSAETETEPSPAKPVEAAGQTEALGSGDNDVVDYHDDDVAVDCHDDVAAEVALVEEVVAPTTKPAVAAVKRAELSTPTALPRRPGKENALKKQLQFSTPDKARVRTPLSNVSSFHNSPLRR